MATLAKATNALKVKNPCWRISYQELLPPAQETAGQEFTGPRTFTGNVYCVYDHKDEEGNLPVVVHDFVSSPIYRHCKITGIALVRMGASAETGACSELDQIIRFVPPALWQRLRQISEVTDNRDVVESR